MRHAVAEDESGSRSRDVRHSSVVHTFQRDAGLRRRYAYGVARYPLVLAYYARYGYVTAVVLEAVQIHTDAHRTKQPRCTSPATTHQQRSSTRHGITTRHTRVIIRYAFMCRCVVTSVKCSSAPRRANTARVRSL